MLSPRRRASHAYLFASQPLPFPSYPKSVLHPFHPLVVPSFRVSSHLLLHSPVLFLLLLFTKSIYHPIGVRFTLHAFVAFWYLRFPQAGISLHDTFHPFPHLGLHPSLVEHSHTSGTAHASHRSRPCSLVTHTALIHFSSFAEGWNSGFTRKTHHIILVHTPM